MAILQERIKDVKVIVNEYGLVLYIYQKFNFSHKFQDADSVDEGVIADDEKKKEEFEEYK